MRGFRCVCWHLGHVGVVVISIAAFDSGCDVRPVLKTMSGGEFDWGGTSVKW